VPILKIRQLSESGFTGISGFAGLKQTRLNQETNNNQNAHPENPTIV
jgi:hypothetical protein